MQTELFGLLLLSELLDLTALPFHLALLLLHLSLSLLLLNFLVLHLVADKTTTQRTHAATDQRACAGMTDGATD
jgi:hypothetical protein